VEEEASGSNPTVRASRSKWSAPSDSEQQRTVLQLIQGTPWMAGWLRNPNRRGSDRDAYNCAHDSPPAGLSGTLDQRPVSTPTPVSPTVTPHPTIPDAETIEPAPITPNAEFIPLAHSTPNAQTVPPAPQTRAPALDQDITTSPGPPPSPAPNTHNTPIAARQNTQTLPKGRRRSTRAPDSFFCGFSFTFSLPV